MRFENPKTSKKPSCSGGISVAEIAVDHTTISQQGGIKINQGEFHHGLQFKGGMHHHVFMFFFSKFGGKACCNKQSAWDQLLF